MEKNNQSETVGTRQRRAHAKSRRGCRNCKLRRVKCDETRPECKKCASFGVTCNFDSKTPDLQMCRDGSITLKPEENPLQMQPRPSQTLRKIEVPAFLYPAVDATVHVDREILDRFGRFYSRTALTIGTQKAAVFMRDATFELCFKHPYLMHVAQTMTAIHDRYLSTTPWSRISRLTPTESYHLSHAASLFNQRLSGPIEPQDRDPLWATASMLGIIAFATIEASYPEQAWPLKPSEPSDFEWISMSEHKMAVWEVTNPLRPDSAFYPLAGDYQALHQAILACDTEADLLIPVEFLKLYEIDDTSTDENHPYYSAVRRIVVLLSVECDRSNIIRFLNFISHTQPEFKRLLREKDPRALVLMVYWYAMVGNTVWWLERRTVLEGQATCLYLERHCPNDTAIHELLKYPKLKLNLLINNKWV